MHISPYDQGNRFNHDPLRTRKLLMHKAEIGRLAGKVKEKGYTLVPMKIYLKQGLVKVELALARGDVYKRQTFTRSRIRRAPTASLPASLRSRSSTEAMALR